MIQLTLVMKVVNPIVAPMSGLHQDVCPIRALGIPFAALPNAFDKGGSSSSWGQWDTKCSLHKETPLVLNRIELAWWSL